MHFTVRVLFPALLFVIVCLHGAAQQGVTPTKTALSYPIIDGSDIRARLFASKES